MPFNYDPNLEDPNDPSQGQGGQGNTQVAGSGSVAGGGTQATAGGNTPGSPAPTRPSNYQNLNAYLDANQGSDFGQQFVGRVNQDVNAAGTAQQQGANEFKAASDAGAVNPNADLINSAVTDPYGFSQNKDNVSSFQKQLDAQYSGPQSYADYASGYQKAAGATQKAQDTAKAAETEGGRFALLNNYFGTPNYNQGQQALDNFLVQADPTTQQGIKQARQNADQAQVDFRNQEAPLQQYAAKNLANSQQANKAANEALYGSGGSYANPTGGAYGGMNTELQNQYTSNLKHDQDLTGALTDFEANLPHYVNATGEDPRVAALGLDPFQTKQLQRSENILSNYGLSKIGTPTALENALSFSAPTNQDMSSMATADQRNKLRALAELSHNTYDEPATNYNPAKVSFDPNAVVKYIQGLPTLNDYAKQTAIQEILHPDNPLNQGKVRF